MTETALVRKPAPLRVRTLDQATAVVGRIGAAEVQLSRLKVSLDVAVAKANLAFENEAAALRAAIAADTELLRGYFDANRSSLLTGKTKSVALPTGMIGVKKSPTKVVVADDDAVLKLLLKDRKLRRFIRTKSTVDKTALLAEPKVAETIDGVSIEGGEDAFFVKPLMVGTA